MPDIEPRLNSIEVLGWDTTPSKVTLTTGSNEPIVIDPSDYSFFTISKKLQISVDLDMNASHTIAFE